MIFLFGTGTSRLITFPLPTVACTYCGIQGKLSVTVFSRYFSVFWIPVFPIGKVSVTVCEHCKQTLTSKEPLPETYRLPVQTVQQQTSTPITNFALLLLLGAGIVLVLVLTQLAPGKKRAAAPESSTTAASLATQNNDADVALGARYKMKSTASGSAYALMEVTRLTDDTVYYKVTSMLRGKPTAASVTAALRDSVPPGSDKGRYPRKMWHFLVQGQGMFRPLILSE
ncbi:zinc-ribbon domain-containing protein [Hymenobacter endophyticus]|uniref:Zinc-ribbon domain-containing protein n=1 Tax=Hymenobacter endophyticus TaxID=3076335 RepID=A0ABU3TC25_9BACT|nr:zinc-ribbon domain-containing protein [Hymenobacter endophyticus]MDU0368917.1 zinc-ribbon domain-containing protein [Hymenobacter endophyticus]